MYEKLDARRRTIAYKVGLEYGKKGGWQTEHGGK